MLLVIFIALLKLRTQETFTISVVPLNSVFPAICAHLTLSLPVPLSYLLSCTFLGAGFTQCASPLAGRGCYTK